MRDDVFDVDRSVGRLDDFDCAGLRFGIKPIRISQSRARAAVILGDALLWCDDDIVGPGSRGPSGHGEAQRPGNSTFSKHFIFLIAHEG